jgi:hypothetical protein
MERSGESLLLCGCIGLSPKSKVNFIILANRLWQILIDLYTLSLPVYLFLLLFFIMDISDVAVRVNTCA